MNSKIPAALQSFRKSPPTSLINSDESSQRPPVSRMRSASARTDECGVGLRHMHCFRDLADSLASEQRLNSLNVTFLCQPTRKTLRVPPRVCHGVVADAFGN